MVTCFFIVVFDFNFDLCKQKKNKKTKFRPVCVHLNDALLRNALMLCKCVVSETSFYVKQFVNRQLLVHGVTVLKKRIICKYTILLFVKVKCKLMDQGQKSISFTITMLLDSVDALKFHFFLKLRFNWNDSVAYPSLQRLLKFDILCVSVNLILVGCL